MRGRFSGRRRPTRRRAWPATVVAVALALAPRAAGAAEPVRVEVAGEVLSQDVRRVGVNLGTWRSWGAEQLGHNVLQNPGFEGVIDRAIVVVRDAGPAGFSDDDRRLGRGDGFWRGARFEVRTGAAAGVSGTVRDSRRAGAEGYPSYTTEGPVPPLAAGDVIALTRTDDDVLPERWHGSERVRAVLDDARPGSPGKRCVGLPASPAQPASLVYYLDGIATRAGKLLPVDGRWRLAFWSRSPGLPARLRVRFVRQGGPPFVEQVLTPGFEWQRTVIDFTARDGGSPGTLELRFEAEGDGEVRLDDVELENRDDPPGAFRAEVVEALRALRPGYLRDWQGGQGATLANRMAAPFARRLTRSSTRAEETIFEYSLPEFLDLCEAVRANPWIVVPTTFSDAEWEALGAYLAERASSRVFPEVIVEFGNENWNPLSRAAGIPDPVRHGVAASRAFEMLRRAAGRDVSLRTAVNGQFANPAAALRFGRAAPGADLLAVAPYFLFSLPAGRTPEQRLGLLFPDDASAFGALADGLRGGRQRMAVYEVNLHTTGGNAGATERDTTVASAAAGTALARRILDAQAARAGPIAAYELAGYDMWTDDRSGFVKLWGLIRDLGATRRWRPTGLAVSLLNRAFDGDRHATSLPTGTPVTVAAYRGAHGWSAVMLSSTLQPASVEIRFPADLPGPLPARQLTLAAGDPWATNEDQENVRVVDAPITANGRVVRVSLPPVGLTVLLPPEVAE